MAAAVPGTPAWLGQVKEEIVEPERRIVDPHHHLWDAPDRGSYLLEDLWADTGSGHRIEKTVFVECRASYRESGPEHLRPDRRDGVRGRDRRGQCRGRIDQRHHRGHRRTRGPDTRRGRGRGASRARRGRAGSLPRHPPRRRRDPHPEDLRIAGRAPEGLYADRAFREGMRVLGRFGLSYDTWHYHHQNAAFADLARAVPETTMVLDHFGTPLGVGRYRDRREEIFAAWKADIAEIARCPNVVAKLGGLAMPDNGFGWHERDLPPTSDEFAETQRRYYLHTIECFGPERCMLESNFPVDKLSLSYHVLWNGLKKIVMELL